MDNLKLTKTEKIGSRSTVFTYALPEWDLNLHIIKAENRNYVIDTGLGSDSMGIVKESLTDSEKPIVVINTHHHWDHIWGNCCFKESLIISHRLCRELAKEHWREMLSENMEYIAGDVEMCLPNLVFEGEMYFPDDKIRIFHSPGHTLDSISVFDETDGVLNAGDNIGDTMEEILPHLETDAVTFLKTIEAYKKLDVRECISGHNKVLGKEVFEMIERKLSV